MFIQSATQDLTVEDIGGNVIEVEQLTNGHHNLHSDSLGKSMIFSWFRIFLNVSMYVHDF